MSESRHTPGPWKVDGYIDSTGVYGIGSEGSCLLHAHVIDYDIDANPDEGIDAHHEAEANARLIASAPALLAALEKAERMLVEQEDALRAFGADEPNAEDAILSARAALAASKGGA